MKLHNIILLLGLSALSFTACDEHAEGERWDDPITTVAKKNVLLEDFTGQDCSNCPRAAETAHQLQETFGTDRVVVVAHCHHRSKRTRLVLLLLRVVTTIRAIWAATLTPWAALTVVPYKHIAHGPLP